MISTLRPAKRSKSVVMRWRLSSACKLAIVRRFARLTLRRARTLRRAGPIDRNPPDAAFHARRPAAPRRSLSRMMRSVSPPVRRRVDRPVAALPRRRRSRAKPNCSWSRSDHPAEQPVPFGERARRLERVQDKSFRPSPGTVRRTAESRARFAVRRASAASSGDILSVPRMSQVGQPKLGPIHRRPARSTVCPPPRRRR